MRPGGPPLHRDQALGEQAHDLLDRARDQDDGAVEDGTQRERSRGRAAGDPIRVLLCGRS
ncbi:MAG: hypothetical protein R3266_15545 [Gemmatimonadota bacterium]|nr:hypothetical protein [Gemmatimonadota bacterium]